MCFSLPFVVVPDSSSSAPRMHFAPTTPQASVVTAGLVSMETDATVYPMVRAAPLTQRDFYGSVLFSLNADVAVPVLPLQVPRSALAGR